MSESSMDGRKVAQWFVVALAISIIVFAYLQLSKPQVDKGNTLQTIPGGASLVCIMQGMGASTDEISLFELLLSSNNPHAALAGWEKSFQSLDSLRRNNRQWYDLLQTAEISFQSSDINNPGTWSLSIALPANTTAETYMSDWLPGFPKRDFKNCALFIGSNIGWCSIKNCIIISPSVAVLEDAVIQIDKNNVLASNANFINSYELRSKDVPFHICSKASEDNWLILNPVFTREGTMLNGYLPTASSGAQALFLHTQPGDLSIANELPESTNFLDVLHAQEFDSAWTSLTQYYQGSEAETFWSQAWQDLGDTCQCDLNEILLSWRSGEYGCAVIETPDGLSEAISFIGISDSINVTELLRPILSPQPQPTDCIYAVAIPMVFQRNAMPSLTIESNFVLQINSFLFCASSPHPLRELRKAGNKLNSKKEFTALLSQANKSSGRFVYQSSPEINLLPNGLSALLEPAGSWSVTTELSRANQLLVSIALPIQIKASATVIAPVSEEPVEQSPIVNDLPIESSKTWTVINHNTQEKETLRQQENNRLELVGADGNVIWSLDMSDKILGDVVQVDALKNNKLQLAFATSAGIYIIDRNGNALPGFPFLPKPPVTSPLLVADYDNTKKYRLIFSVGDGDLFNLGIDGKPTSGWKFNASSEETIIAVKTDKVGSDDVIFTVSDQGSVQLLKRTGETKVKCSTKLEGFDGKTIDIIPGSDFNTTSIVYSSGSNVKTIQLQTE
jgi:hypothetical protein